MAMLRGLICDAPDLPGHGLSKAPVPTGALDELVEPIEALFLGGPPAWVVGHSLGGGIALRLAARHPDHVKGLLLFAPLGLGTGMDQTRLESYARLHTVSEMTDFLETLVHDRSLIMPVFAEYALDQLNAPGIRPALAKIAAQLPAGEAALQPDIDLLVGQPFPIKVYWGGEDKIISPATDRINKIGQLVRLPDVGHIPHVEARRTVMQIFKDLLLSAS